MAQRILVVDDDREIVRLVLSYLEKSEYEVLVAYDGETALDILRRERPDLVLMDLKPPGRDGHDVTRFARDNGSLAVLPIIMLTARGEDRDQIVDLELGGADNVGRQLNPREVLVQVRAVLKRAHGETPQPRLIQAGKVTLDLDAHQAEVSNKPVHLTPTEFALLRALAEHPGRAITRLELIEEAMGYSYEGVERTVDSHVKNLRRKLDEVSGSAQLIETVFGVGYRLDVGTNSETI